MQLSISEILKSVNDLSTPVERSIALAQHHIFAMQQLLKMNFDKNLEWDMPEGAPPYEPATYPDQQGQLYHAVKKLYLFHKGGNPNLTRLRRESIFKDMLESLDPSDAELLIAVKDKSLNKLYPNITPEIVKAAYPGLLVY
jgi:hypothetical protein